MAGYSDTRQMIIDTLMGRPAGTEIQPEDHQAFALQITDYVRSVELVAGNATPIGFADALTVPVQPDNGQALYLSQVGRGTTVVFTNFIDQSGNAISVTSDSSSVTLVNLLWNGQYWTKQETRISLENTIQENDIADGAVTTDKIKDGAVTETKIADDAVTTKKLQQWVIRQNDSTADIALWNEIKAFNPLTSKIPNIVFIRDNGSILPVQKIFTIAAGEMYELQFFSFSPDEISVEKINPNDVHFNIVKVIIANYGEVSLNVSLESRPFDYVMNIKENWLWGTVLKDESIDASKLQNGSVTKSKLEQAIQDLLDGAVQSNKLSPILQEIDLTGTDADRKAKLDKFETDWKALTGASDLSGARFVGKFEYNNETVCCLFTYAVGMKYGGVFTFNDGDDNFLTYMAVIENDPISVPIHITPAVDYSHLEAITIKTGNTTSDKADNKDAIQAYIDNLTALGVDTTKGYTIPVYINGIGSGFLCKTGDNIIYYMGVMNMYGSSSFGICVDAAGGYYAYKLQTETDHFLTTTSKKIVGAINEVYILAQGVKAFGAIELKASDDAANKTALAAYLKILTDAGVDITNGYAVPVRITGNSQEYHGMLNIGTGVLLSGIVTDVNENHHYPFNVSTTDGVITFDESNYFLEKTSNEVTEMLDAIKYSHTSVPFTDTTLSNKAQLEVFLSKVPDATVMHCTYKEIWAGTLHKINGDWYGLLVKNTNSPADNINIKLSADGTVITSNSAQ